MGLSTIASLSLGLSMSMTGAGRAVICRSLGSTSSPHPSPPPSAGLASSHGGGQLSTTTSTVDDERRRRSLQQLFPLPASPGCGDGSLRAPLTPSLGPRRTSFVGIMQHMSAAAQNRLGLLLEPSMSVMSTSRSPPRAWGSTFADRRIVENRSTSKSATACHDQTNSSVAVDIGETTTGTGDGDAKSDWSSTCPAENVDPSASG